MLASLVVCLSLLAWLAGPATAEFRKLWGSWQTESEDLAVKIEPNRLMVLQGEKVSILPVRDLRTNEVIVAQDGGHVALPLVWDEGDLLLALERDAPPQRFHRSAKDLPALELHPADIGGPRPLSDRRIDEIQREIARRFKRDQAALQGEGDKISKSVLEANKAYLATLIQDVGWIDRDRFGARTSYQALVLAKHGGDLSLLLAILPLAEGDFQGDTENPGAYPIVLDSSRLLLGEKQVYGTQIETDMAGNPILAPLEDPETVDARRVNQGLQPLEEYLALASQMLFDGDPIRLPFKSPR